MLGAHAQKVAESNGHKPDRYEPVISPHKSEHYDDDETKEPASIFESCGHQVALCPNSTDVQIYKREANGGWSRGQTLSRHDLRVTSIDWAPQSNRIVTCAADRNACSIALTSVKMSAKRASYNLKFKRAAIAFAEDNGNHSAAAEFGVDRACIIRWRKQRDQILKGAATRKKFTGPRKGRHPELEEEVCENCWSLTDFNGESSSVSVSSSLYVPLSAVDVPPRSRRFALRPPLLQSSVASPSSWYPVASQKRSSHYPENKFAVGSGAKLVSVCYFEEDHNWWVSKHIKKPIKSTVTSVDWHPNNCLLACGSTDFRTRVFSAYIKEVDSPPEPTPWGDKTASFGSLVAELSASGIGWVHSVCFSGDGTRLAWVGHDSSICVADAQQGQAIKFVRTQYLPFLSCLWISPTRLLVSGYDCSPMVYEYRDGQLKFVEKLDKSQRKEVDGVSAMRKFRNMDKHAMESRGDTLLDTAHQNAITLVTLVQGKRDNASRVCSQGMDGRLILWDIKTLQSSMAGMHIV
ncbi:hypothetical protein HPB52_006951 [Rhipicephalus sanguineus]|uniref:Arp2/3 complex 41 kDa subunit n=1 Tax=Rhipicephalus sanguineus TaxID=34632 RepID=A0A9D4SQE5_RHISA|nr:hypothetical protein HPB52_006951 [Rhipicephalus sanguineus]